MTTIATTTTTLSGSKPAMTPSPLTEVTTSPTVDGYADERIQRHPQYNTNRISPLRERYPELEPVERYVEIDPTNASATSITRSLATSPTNSVPISPNISRQSSSSHPTPIKSSTRLFFPAGGLQHQSLPKPQPQHGVKDPMQRYHVHPSMEGQRESVLQATCQNEDSLYVGPVPVPNFRTNSAPTYPLFPDPRGRGSDGNYSAIHGRTNDINHRLRTWSLVEDSFHPSLNPLPSSPLFSASLGGVEEGRKGGNLPPPIDILPYGTPGGIAPAPIIVASYGSLKRPKDEPPDSDMVSIPSPFLRTSDTPPMPSDITPIRANITPMTLSMTPMTPNMTQIRPNMTPVTPSLPRISPNMTAIRLDMPPLRPDVTPVCRGLETHSIKFNRSIDGLNQTTTTTFSPTCTVTHPFGGSYTPGTPHTHNPIETRHGFSPSTTPSAASTSSNQNTTNQSSGREEEIGDVEEEEDDWNGRLEDEQRFVEEDEGKDGGEGGGGGGEDQRRRRAKRTYVYNPKPITRRSNNPHLNKQLGRVDEAYRKRREYNNEAARRSRNNRRAQEIRTLEQTRRLTEENQRLLGQIDELRKQNNALEERNKELEKEKNHLRDILHHHNMSTLCSDM